MAGQQGGGAGALDTQPESGDSITGGLFPNPVFLQNHSGLSVPTSPSQVQAACNQLTNYHLATLSALTALGHNFDAQANPVFLPLQQQLAPGSGGLQTGDFPLGRHAGAVSSGELAAFGRARVASASGDFADGMDVDHSGAGVPNHSGAGGPNGRATLEVQQQLTELQLQQLQQLQALQAQQQRVGLMQSLEMLAAQQQQLNEMGQQQAQQQVQQAAQQQLLQLPLGSLGGLQGMMGGMSGLPGLQPLLLLAMQQQQQQQQQGADGAGGGPLGGGDGGGGAGSGLPNLHMLMQRRNQLAAQTTAGANQGPGPAAFRKPSPTHLLQMQMQAQVRGGGGAGCTCGLHA